MKDVKVLQETIKNVILEQEAQHKKTMEILEKAADTLIDECQHALTLQPNGFFSEAKEIFISFSTIGVNFDTFVIDFIRPLKEVGFVEKCICGRSQEYRSLKWLIANSKEPISRLTSKSYDNILLLSDILEKRGFFCCTQNKSNGNNFAVVFKVQEG